MEAVPNPLTRPEVMVLNLAAQDFNNIEIARFLGTTGPAIRYRFHCIRKRLHAASRRDALRIAIDNGWLDGRSIPREPRTQMRLSRREFSILRLLIAGLSNAEIARELGLKRYTIKANLTTIYCKMGAKSRTHAVVIALCKGWVSAKEAETLVLRYCGDEEARQSFAQITAQPQYDASLHPARHKPCPNAPKE